MTSFELYSNTAISVLTGCITCSWLATRISPVAVVSGTLIAR